VSGRTDSRGPRREVERLTGTHVVRAALAARRRRLIRLRLRSGDARPEWEALAKAAAAAGVPVVPLPRGRPDEEETSGGGRGVELEAGPLPELALEELIEACPAESTLIALDGVEDPQNVGTIARVAEGAGAAGLILTRRRSPPLSPAVSRASAGAVEWLPVARVPNLPRALNLLKEKEFWIFGCDPEATASIFDASDRQLRGARVLVLGAEGKGLRRGVEQVLDHRVRIPMAGHVDSLNVATAAALLLFEFRRRSDLATPA